ncbi:MAG TPA: FAD-dependent oxidoreductase [Candidatus Dormibacteraeota bacterium]|nr:FAD-dependent oxidoreductase [Candidatus Dormibacteraeota bacterium]
MTASGSQHSSGPRLSRRTMLGSMAVAGAGVALNPLRALAAAPQTDGTPDATRTPNGTIKADVVVIGAGFAGLSAARRLRAKGLSVVVLEARDRVGGRTLNQDLAANGFPGRVVEMGGQFVGPMPDEPATASVPTQAVYNPQDRILKLATDVGVGTFKTYNAGNYTNYTTTTGPVPYSSSTRIPPDPGAANAGLALGLLNQMAAQVPTDKPWTAANAAKWDGETVESWMRRTFAPQGQDPESPTNHLVTLAVQAVLSTEPREISLLQLLFYVASAGSLDNLIDTANGAQDSRFIGGSQEIAIRVAKQLGSSLVLNAPVRKISHAGGLVTASGDGFSVTARQAIVAIPPALAGRIVYEPSLASLGGHLRDQLTQRWFMGSILKVNVIYPRPFWRDTGLAAQVTSDSGAVRATFDNTPYPDSQGSDVQPGAILGFIEADEARYWSTRSRAERYQRVIADLANYFGPQALQPLGGINGYYEALWNLEPFSGGGPVGHPMTGALTEYGTALRAPVGLVHWAGTETAVRWNGYMDGAVESGMRAADEVLGALGGTAGPALQPESAAVQPASASLPNTAGVPAGVAPSAAAAGALGVARLVRSRTRGRS